MSPNPHHGVIIISQNHKIRALFGFRNDGSRSIFFWGKRCSNLGKCLIGSISSAGFRNWAWQRMATEVPGETRGSQKSMNKSGMILAQWLVLLVDSFLVSFEEIPKVIGMTKNHPLELLGIPYYEGFDREFSSQTIIQALPSLGMTQPPQNCVDFRQGSLSRSRCCRRNVTYKSPWELERCPSGLSPPFGTF